MGGTQNVVEGLTGLVAQTVLSADSDERNSLEGIDVTGLVDRAVCYVREYNALYRWFDTSVAAANVPFVVAPASGATGRWVWISADALVPGGAHIQTTLAVAQAAVDLTGEDILLDTIGVNGGVAYNPVTGLYTLTEYLTYELEAYLDWDTWNDPATDVASWEWVKTDNSAVVANAAGVAFRGTNGISTQSCAKAIVTVPAGGLDVKIRAQNGAGSANLVPGTSFATVRRF